MELPTASRRKFLLAIANLGSAGWIAMNWPQIAYAAQGTGAHAGHAADPGGPPTRITTLTAAEAADVEAIANQIVPGGTTPGARAAGVIIFIDNALGSFFAEQLPSFREGLADFQRFYAKEHGSTPFAAAPDAQQIAWLREVDRTPFFAAVRRLTVLGLIALPKYGGNRDYAGWTMLGVEDNHSWAPPFGFYDTDYPGFEPYPGTKPYMA
jgi:gluconate 2-dehydrogenase gamma chain